ncbi:MAG TPA: tRNA-dihydrouridine synthase [Candidatus Kaiserbacteria bacterium]|nr:tRNA-dihydrouridine synthase [Candidatus Kaiserbacteria bacterium]
MKSFWHMLPRPFFALAPMADVTDVAFRRLVMHLGKPDVFFTEFVSADGLFHLREIKKVPDDENPLLRDLMYARGEQPIVAQLFGSNIETMRYAAGVIARLGFAGVDINMGCPDRSVEKQGAGAALIKNPVRAVELIEAVKDGIKGAGSEIPVSIKTRIGYDKEIIDEWIPTLLKGKPDAITVHLRTRKEMSEVSAHWEYMERIVKLRDASGAKTLMIGNGDVHTLEEAKEKVLQSGADGIMVGRAIFGNPWFFIGRTFDDTPVEERIAALIMFSRFFEELSSPKPFHIFKKHIKAFVNGFPHATELRAKLMNTNSADELIATLNKWGG